MNFTTRADNIKIPQLEMVKNNLGQKLLPILYMHFVTHELYQNSSKFYSILNTAEQVDDTVTFAIVTHLFNPISIIIS